MSLSVNRLQQSNYYLSRNKIKKTPEDDTTTTTSITALTESDTADVDIHIFSLNQYKNTVPDEWSKYVPAELFDSRYIYPLSPD